ncbi:hypothetical protein HZA42_05315 [Candidatus Peregrinibacteria bacterium]|nr:hypothetical protein [Candidatus Peregrinibacteria bacterium]
MSHEKSCCGLKASRLASAATIVAAVIYFVCATASIFWPETFLKLMNTMAHSIDLTKGTPVQPVTIGSFALGFVQTIAYTYIVVYFFAWTYNKLSGNKVEASAHGDNKSCCH